MYSDEVLWQKKRRIQKEGWYQRERNKEISVLKKNSLSYILGEMHQELDVLMALFDAQQASEREEQKRCNDANEREGLLPLFKVVDDDYWQEKNSKGFKKRLKLCPLSLLMI